MLDIPNYLDFEQVKPLSPLLQVADEFNEGVENTELYWIDKCGHAAMMEHPEEFNTHLDDWLAKTE